MLLWPSLKSLETRGCKKIADRSLSEAAELALIAKQKRSFKDQPFELAQNITTKRLFCYKPAFCLPPGAIHFVEETYQGPCYRNLVPPKTAQVYLGSHELVKHRSGVKGSV